MEDLSSRTPTGQVLLASLAALSFHSFSHVHPRCGDDLGEVGWELGGSRVDWEKEPGKQEWVAVKKKWWRTAVTRRGWDYRGEQPRLKPLEANSRERDRL